MPGAALLASGFVNPALLGGLALIALPIMIHFLSRRRFRRIEWGATLFLLQAEKENRRRVRFEQWLLLALRCLALALLAALVARPFVQPGLITTLLGSGGQTHRVILIDDSASLAFRDGPRIEFDRLRDAADRLLGWLKDGAPGARVTIFRTSEPETPIAQDVRLTEATLPELRSKLAALEPGYLPAQPRRALAQIAEKLRGFGAQDPADVYVLSDFQRSEWFADAAQSDSVFAAIAELQRDSIRVVLVASADRPRDNTAILEVALDRPQTVAGFPAVCTARLANYTSSVIRDLAVQSEVNGAPLPPVAVDAIAAGEEQTVSFEVTVPDEGFADLAFSIESYDDFAADNTFRMSVHVKPVLSVLIVDGQPSTDPMRDEVHFLRTALAPPGSVVSGIRVEVIVGSEIESTVVDEFDCVLLCNVAPPGAGAARVLSRFVRQGGGLAFFLGDQIGDGQEYNRLFYAGGQGVLPTRLVGLREFSGPDRPVGLLRTREHPLTAMFPDGSAALSESVRFRKYYRCRAPQTEVSSVESAGIDDGIVSTDEDHAAVLARFTDDAQSPALIEKRIGLGRVVLFASSVDLDWNDWPRSADGSYVVTMLELVQYLAGSGPGRRMFRAGERLEVALLPDRYEPSGLFKSPLYPDEPAQQGTLRESGQTVDEPVVLEGPIATQLGAYTVDLNHLTTGPQTRPLAVNLAQSESNLLVASQDELSRALSGVRHDYVSAGESFLKSEAESRRELWPVLLVLLVGALMFEQFLALWFGRPKRVTLAARDAAGATTPTGRI